MFNPQSVHAKPGLVQCQKQESCGFSGAEISTRLIRVEQLWQDFFANPSLWWDCRCTTNNPKHPDFKSKDTRDGLWIENWLNPPWVKAKVAAMGLDKKKCQYSMKSREPHILFNGESISKVCQEGRLEEAIDTVDDMVEQNIGVSFKIYGCILRGCSKKMALAEGKRVHALIVQSQLDSNVFLGNALVNMYGKCRALSDARKVFNSMPERNVFSWTSIISAYVYCGDGEGAIYLFQQMRQSGISPNVVTFIVTLKACALVSDLEEGRQLHLDIIKFGFESNTTMANTLIHMYAKCGSIEDALKVFNSMQERTLVSWTAMITGYSQLGLGKESLNLYEQMQQEGVRPNNVTYLVLLNACANIAALDKGRQLHLDIIENGFDSDVMIGNSLIDMYAKCQCIEDACRVFSNMHHRTVVSWNSMIAGYTEQGLGMKALALYEHMKQKNVNPNGITYVCLLKACANIRALEEGKQLHMEILQNGLDDNISIGNTLIDMYAKCECIEDACRVFNNMCDRSMVSWTAMIAGYVLHGLCKEALDLYEQMKEEGVLPGVVTYMVLLKACANTGGLEKGKRIHSNIIEREVELHLGVGSALVDMYAKCGCLEAARRVFTNMHVRDVVSWTSMIAGYAQQGLGKEALMLFDDMQREGIQPNEVTYLNVLSGCSHSGLVEKGLDIFNRMSEDHTVIPTMDHYACMVDLLGRNGYLAEAEDFISKMPIQPNAVVWTTLLGAARNHGHVELGKRAFDCAMRSISENAAPYVLLSNIYAATGQKDEAAIYQEKNAMMCTWEK